MATTYSIATAGTVPTLAGTTTRTFSWTPKKVGNAIIVALLWSPSTPTISSISSSNAVWATLIARQTLQGAGEQAFIGIATSTVLQTVSVVFSANPTSGVQLDVIEISADDIGFNPGIWRFNTGVTNATTATTITYPAGSVLSFDGLYLGWATPGSAATAGSTAGFTYPGALTDGNWFIYNLTYGNSAVAPTQPQTSSSYVAFGVALFFQPLWVPSTIGGST